MEASKPQVDQKGPVAVDDTGAASPPKRRYVIEQAPSSYYVSARGISTKDADVTTEKLNKALAVLMAWPNWDIWPFKIACPLLAMAGGIPGAILNSSLRRYLVLDNIGRVPSYLATVGLPVITTGVLHYSFVMSDVLQQKTACPVCVQVRAASLQLLAGFVYPLFLAPIVTFSLGSRVKGIYLPNITKQPRAVGSLVADVFKTKSVKSNLLYAGVAQVVLSMGITYLEQNSYYKTLLPIIRGEVTLSKETRKKTLFSE